MHCPNCSSLFPDGAKFCGKCGSPVGLNQEVAGKTKTVSGFRVALGIVAAIAVLGILGKYIAVAINTIAMLFGVDSTEVLANVDALANIIGFLGGAYLARLAYMTIIGHDKTTRKNKYQPILTGVIVAVAIAGLALSVASDSSKMLSRNETDSGSLSSSGDTWIDYSAPESNFSVRIPSRPVHDTSNQDNPSGMIRVDSYKTADDSASVAYAINVSKFSEDADLSDSSGVLENTVELSANNGVVITSNPTTHDGYPAIDYLIQFHHQGTVSNIQGVNILVGQRLYQLFTAYDSTDKDKLELDKFIDSFELN